MIELPYEIIGKAVIFTVVTVATAALLFTIEILAYTVWYRTMTAIVNKMWGEIDVYDKSDLPPKWKRVIAKYALFARRLDTERLAKHDELVEKMKDD